jgi:probable phosphoglycerate mutase
MAQPEPEPKLTRLVLIRHGQSRATVDQIAGGERGCTGLTDFGARQVEALRERVTGTDELAGTTALLASTLPRAVETAEILAPALGGLPVVTYRDLSELQPGEGDGLTWGQWGARFGGFRMADEPYRPLAPGGESWAEFQLRVGRTLSALIVAEAGGLVVIACHGGIIEGSIRNFLGLGWLSGADALETPANASMTEWTCVVQPTGALSWRLVRYNDAAHLATVMPN